MVGLIDEREAEIARDLVPDDRQALVDLLIRVAETPHLDSGIHPHPRARSRSTCAVPEQ
ncbi:hypothetical protein [Candidatus Frankia alpina]|uniref:hypothetical protein n=1 Tax=Candidatus Frankia alpina TaxID=2699483 RepID=UPI001386B1B0|nr:hypothetical protein [Candidatus Frankia alpina]